MKDLRLVILKFRAGENKTSKFLHCQTRKVFDKNPLQCLWIRLQTFLNVLQHLNYDATFTVILKFYNFGTISRIWKMQRAKQVWIKFPVDLDAERNRARNYVFSVFWCFIEFSVQYMCTHSCPRYCPELLNLFLLRTTQIHFLIRNRAKILAWASTLQ